MAPLTTNPNGGNTAQIINTRRIGASVQRLLLMDCRTTSDQLKCDDDDEV